MDYINYGGVSYTIHPEDYNDTIKKCIHKHGHCHGNHKHHHHALPLITCKHHPTTFVEYTQYFDKPWEEHHCFNDIISTITPSAHAQHHLHHAVHESIKHEIKQTKHIKKNDTNISINKTNIDTNRENITTNKSICKRFSIISK